MANPTGTINADEDHSGRTLIKSNPTAAQDAATKAYADSVAAGGVNSFGTIVVSGQSSVVADAAPDTLTLVAGSNVTLTTNATTDTVTIAATGGGGSGDVVGPGSATDNAIARFDATTGKLIQNSVVAVSDTGAIAFPAGVRQTFDPNGTTPGINVGAISGDPSTPSNGDLWYDSLANELTARVNGTNVTLGGGTVGNVATLTTGKLVVGSSPNNVNVGDLTGDVTTSGGTATTLVGKPAGTIVGTSDTQTLTNKRINPRVDASTSASASTWAPNSDTTDIFELAGVLTVAVTTISNPSGTPVDGQKLIIRVKDNGTARALTWSGSQWRASSDLALPTTTILSKTLYLGFIYNSADTKWDLLALLNNF